MEQQPIKNKYAELYEQTRVQRKEYFLNIEQKRKDYLNKVSKYKDDIITHILSTFLDPVFIDDTIKSLLIKNNENYTYKLHDNCKDLSLKIKVKYKKIDNKIIRYAFSDFLQSEEVHDKIKEYNETYSPFHIRIDDMELKIFKKNILCIIV
jgi:hypothetical protein